MASGSSSKHPPRPPPFGFGKFLLDRVGVVGLLSTFSRPTPKNIDLAHSLVFRIDSGQIICSLSHITRSVWILGRRQQVAVLLSRSRLNVAKELEMNESQ